MTLSCFCLNKITVNYYNNYHNYEVSLILIIISLTAIIIKTIIGPLLNKIEYLSKNAY